MAHYRPALTNVTRKKKQTKKKRTNSSKQAHKKHQELVKKPGHISGQLIELDKKNNNKSRQNDKPC